MYTKRTLSTLSAYRRHIELVPVSPLGPAPPCLHINLEPWLCSTLQHTAAHCSTLQHTATHCNTLQHTTTHCNTGVPVSPNERKASASGAHVYTSCMHLSCSYVSKWHSVKSLIYIQVALSHVTHIYTSGMSLIYIQVALSHVIYLYTYRSSTHSCHSHIYKWHSLIYI